jgi:spermidine synthase
MTQSFARLLRIIFLASCLMPIILAIPDRFRNGKVWTPAFLGLAALGICLAAVLTFAFHYFLKRMEPRIDGHSLGQAGYLDNLPLQFVDLAIVGSAALSLFLELAVIRWQGTVFEFFAFYKNFGLLSCFVGLGLGYALANRDRIPLILTLPLLAWQFFFMIVLRFGLGRSGLENISATPFREQLNMGAGAMGSLSRVFALYCLLPIVFLITALGFVPIGQLCGRLMERRAKLRAYGLNLLGSLLGVVLMLTASLLWTPPLVWFALCFLAILLFLLKKPASLMVATGFAMLAAIVLAWPVNPFWQRLYSPYQLLEIGQSDENGLMLIRAAGHYYQRVHDLSPVRTDPKLKGTRDYYELPYKVRTQLADVAVVGAGTGNDVSAALRSGAGRVDAIEIDPAILMAGQANHPEHPYSDPRVHPVVNDARSFLRNTDHTYDMIVYGLLDSHTLLSQASSVRLDSFVYTVEGLREARARLKPDGVISLSFTVMSDRLAKKIYLMLQQVFDGRPPICVIADYDGAVIFLESNSSTWSIPPDVVKGTGFQVGTARYADPAIQADVSTDDWPFFYMPQRVYPVSYLVMIVQVLLMSWFVTGSFLSEKPRFSHFSFFFLGVGFMLVETKGITEMGLTFGNTWQVIGIVIASILVMAFLANFTVQRLKIQQPWIPYLLLLASLALGWMVAGSGGFSSTVFGRLETAAVLTCPLFFSGIVFSTLLSTRGQVSGVMSMNLLGAMCGGLLEYNSMYFGFRSLYLIAMACYALAFLSDRLSLRVASVDTVSAGAAES